MNALATRVRTELGPLGLAGMIVLSCAVAFLVLVIQPMEREQQKLFEQLARNADGRGNSGALGALPAAAGAKLAAFYQFFDRREKPTDWLAKLYGIASASGVEFSSADYRLVDAHVRLERYEIVLPVRGQYSQIRAFLENALNEIPILSLDQASFERDRVNQSEVSAELTLSLYWLKR